MDWLNITLFFSMTLVVLILAWGLITMAKGGEYNKSYSNILPPLSILNNKDCQKLIEDIKKIDFNYKN